MGFEDLKIRDLSRLSGEWTPPIGVMGGPPAHELYADLVLYAGLQLFRDTKSRPWVVLRDGAQRRAFLAPSPELRSALDRFRMRRNLRPVPESDIEEFVRVVAARTSDPDVAIPILRFPMVERALVPPRDPSPPEPARPAVPRWMELDNQIKTELHELDELYRNVPGSLFRSSHPTVPEGTGGTDPSPTILGEKIDSSISGARRLPASEDADFGRYVRVLRELVHDGSWMGTTQELSKLTRDDPLTMFDSLLRYRSELADNDILLANIEVEDGYRWLAVDRTKTRNASQAGPSTDRALLAE